MTQQQLETPSWVDEHARAVAEVVEYALAASDLDALLRRALESVAAALSASHGVVAEFDAIRDTLLGRASIGWHRDESASVLQQITERAQKRRALRRGGTTILDEIHTEQTQLLSQQSLAEYGLSAAIGMVIPGESRPFGLLVLFAETPATFDHADAHFLHTIANVLAISIARLRADEQRELSVDQVTQAKNEWERTVDALPELVCLLDQSGCVIRANRALEQWGLGTVRSVRGRSVHALLHPACEDWDCPLDWDCQDAWQALAKQDIVERDVYDRLQARELRLSYRSCAPAAHGASETQTSSAVLVVEDISDRKRAQRAMEQYNQELQCRVQERTLELSATNARLQGEIEAHIRNKEALVESERRYSSIVANTLTGIYVSLDDTIAFCNERLCQIFGYTRQEMSGMPVQRLFDTDVCRLRPDGTLTDASCAWMPSERVIRGITRDGVRIWLKSSMTTIESGGRPALLGNLIDITEQKRIEETLRDSEHELRSLSSQLLNAQETERKRIASELHDGIGQRLSAVKFNVENILGGSDKQSAQVYREQLQAVVQRIRDAIEEVRRISMDLRPSTLDDLGIVATIGWFCREYQAVLPELTLVKSIEVDERDISDTLKVVIFRILQEALNNIAKHANARRVFIDLAKVDREIRLCIRDDGEGFELTKEKVSASGFGLKSMKERTELSAGIFSMTSTRGVGTTIEARWPPP